VGNPTKNLFIITDLEGVAGVTRFEQARGNSPGIDHARDLLTAELNSVIDGINHFDNSIGIHAWDGHGYGGIAKDKLLPVKKYLPPSHVNLPRYFRDEHVEALLFVGQHAMSNTPRANLCHTMSHETIDHYAINDTLVGEFGLWAAVAGEIGMPTIYLSGDDKACEEAKRHVPDIVATAVKTSTGWETATDDPDIHERLYHDVQRSLKLEGNIPPFALGTPVVLEIAGKGKFNGRSLLRKGGNRVGRKIVVFHSDSLENLVAREII
jgi:D-amino peptidase